MSPTPDSTLDDPQQTIADLKRQLAESNAERDDARRRLAESTTERDEALEQQTATAEVLGVINSSPGDLAPVFDALLTKAMHLCDVAFGTLRLYDGERFHLAASQGASPALLDFQREPLRPGPGAARMLAGQDIVNVPDIIEGEAYRSGSAAQRALVELGSARSHLSVALRRGLTLLGYISVYRQEVRPFSDKQIALLQNFAAQAVIAMENARLITETREALEQQTATAEVLGVINSSPGDLAPVFDAMLEKALRLCDGAYGSLLTFDGEKFFHGATRGETLFTDWARQRGSFSPPSGGLLDRALKGEDIIQITDDEIRQNSASAFRQIVELCGYRSALNVTLRQEHAFFGVITIFRKENRPFSDKQIALLQNFAAQAVIAMENARLITETREALEQQTATAEVLQVINSSPGDLPPVFDAMLDKAHALCGAAFRALEEWDGERIRGLATRGLPAPFEALIREGYRPGPNAAHWQLVDGARFVHIPDQAAVDDPAHQKAAEVGFRTFLAVALRKDNVLLGRIVAARQEVRPFAEKEIGLLENFAAQAVIAMENARLLGELRQRTDEVGELNRGLEARVAEQVDELGRVGRLKRFLAPQLAELIVSQGDEKILESHRREIVVVFCDLRGYTAFTEAAEPEEVLDFLREYHGALGPLVSEYEGTLDQFSGDGIMVFFNDPVPCPDPAERAVKMAVAMREEAGKLIATWRRDGCELGFGAGIAQGYATLGQIGFSERSGYTAIGTVCNLAARLCAEAKDAQILISSRVARAVEAIARLEDLGNLELKGLRRPIAAFNVAQSTSPAEARPNLTVVTRAPKA